MLAGHIFGIIGEFFNLGGAVLLGIEMFFRSAYRKKDTKLAAMHDLAVANRLESMVYHGVRVIDSDFKEQVSEKRAKGLGIAGCLLLAVGFLLLVVYHLVEAGLLRIPV